MKLHATIAFAAIATATLASCASPGSAFREAIKNPVEACRNYADNSKQNIAAANRSFDLSACGILVNCKNIYVSSISIDLNNSKVADGNLYCPGTADLNTGQKIRGELTFTSDDNVSSTGWRSNSDDIDEFIYGKPKITYSKQVREAYEKAYFSWTQCVRSQHQTMQAPTLANTPYWDLDLRASNASVARALNGDLYRACGRQPQISDFAPPKH